MKAPDFTVFLCIWEPGRACNAPEEPHGSPELPEVGELGPGVGFLGLGDVGLGPQQAPSDADDPDMNICVVLSARSPALLVLPLRTTRVEGVVRGLWGGFPRDEICVKMCCVTPPF